MSYTGSFWYSEAAANSFTKQLTKGDKIYYTSIKGLPAKPNIPEECWAITNRFDPTVREENANTST